MIQRGARGRRGAVSAQTMFLAAAGILVVAGIVAFWALRTREEKKEEVIGKVGYQSPFKLARKAGINLPIGDHARTGAAAAETTVEVPIEWGKNLAANEQKLAERYAAIAAGLTRPEGVHTFGETITLKVDRDLEYRNLVQAVLAGQKEGFLKFRIACWKTGEQTDVGYLDVELPTDVPVGKNVLLFRMYRKGEIIRYVFGVSKVREYTSLSNAAKVMENTVNVLKQKDPALLRQKILVLSPSIVISVQNVVEGLNAATYAGFERIALGRPSKLY